MELQLSFDCALRPAFTPLPDLNTGTHGGMKTNLTISPEIARSFDLSLKRFTIMIILRLSTYFRGLYREGE